VEENKIECALQGISINQQESIYRNYEYGLRQLSEIALRALSPGLNDPGTAIISLRALIDLLGYRGLNFPPITLSRNKNPYVLHRLELSFDELFERTIYPIWDYGSEDRMLRQELKILLDQLSLILSSAPLFKLLKLVDKRIKQE
jgi:uncharacterized membrane protein